MDSALQPRHPMAVVCRRTGLKPDLVRAWERRYRAVEPARSKGGRRLYSDVQIDRLRLLRLLTEHGHPIRQIAPLSDGELEQLLKDARAPWQPLPTPTPGSPELQELLESCLTAVRRFDGPALGRGLERAAVLLNRRDWIERFVVPLLNRVGELWHQGQMRPAQEHLLTAHLRTVVGQMLHGYRLPSWAPRLVVSTPAGQVHELGALLVAATAAGEGWQAVYLGADLPSVEIALAAEQLHARAVALSVTFVDDPDELAREIGRLCRQLDPQIELLVGGQLAGELARRQELESVTFLEDLGSLRPRLGALVQP